MLLWLEGRSVWRLPPAPTGNLTAEWLYLPVQMRSSVPIVLLFDLVHPLSLIDVHHQVWGGHGRVDALLILLHLLGSELLLSNNDYDYDDSDYNDSPSYEEPHQPASFRLHKSVWINVLCKAHSLIVKVIDGVELLQEDISQNIRELIRGWPLKTKDTVAWRIPFRSIDQVVFGRDGEGEAIRELELNGLESLPEDVAGAKFITDFIRTEHLIVILLPFLAQSKEVTAGNVDEGCSSIQYAGTLFLC